MIFPDFLKKIIIFLFVPHLLKSILPVCLWIFLSFSVQKEASQKMNIFSTESALLSTSCGKYVCIEGRRRRSPSQSHELVTKNRQESDLGNSAKGLNLFCSNECFICFFGYPELASVTLKFIFMETGLFGFFQFHFFFKLQLVV